MGKIKMGGSAFMEFEPDYYRCTVSVSVEGATSGAAVADGRAKVEEILRALRDELGIEIESIVLSKEKVEEKYNRNIYEFSKAFYFDYAPDNAITEAIAKIFENFTSVEYSVHFNLNDEDAKRKQVISLALEDANKKAELLANALGSKIVGFEEIEYRYDDCELDDESSMDWMIQESIHHKSNSLASQLKNQKIRLEESVEVIWLTE